MKAQFCLDTATGRNRFIAFVPARDTGFRAQGSGCELCAGIFGLPFTKLLG